MDQLDNLVPTAGSPPASDPSPPAADAGTSILDYKISLENYYGPLDLLLHLVREQEIDIEKVSLARVAEQYCRYLDMMKSLDINLAGEFLVMAATLMAIKARALVPEPAPEEAEEEDPSLELIRKLIEYRKFKERARLLGLRAEERARRFARGVPREEAPPPIGGEGEAQAAAPGAPPPKDLDLWPLVTSFAALTRQLRLDVPMSILYADVPIERFMEMVLERLRKAGRMAFAELAGTADKMKVVGTFLAVLYLAKEQRVTLEEEGGGIQVGITEDGRTAVAPATLDEPRPEAGASAGSDAAPPEPAAGAPPATV
jgi:segregation and condensation protein A